jgi:uncharacterized protein YjbJ (UPF0337 family)
MQSTAVEENNIMGTVTRTIKGKLKKAEGRVTGDKVREAQGNVEEKAGEIGTRVRAKVAETKARVRAKQAKSKAGRKASAAKAMP